MDADAETKPVDHLEKAKDQLDWVTETSSLQHGSKDVLIAVTHTLIDIAETQRKQYEMMKQVYELPSRQHEAQQELESQKRQLRKKLEMPFQPFDHSLR